MAIVRHRARFKRGISLVLGALLLAACDRDKILKVTDPDIINPSDLASAEAAEALRTGALSRLNDISAGNAYPGGIFGATGLIADEWRSTDTFVQRNEWDSRLQLTTNSATLALARGLYRTRVAAELAIPVLRTYKPAEVSDVGQMWWVHGWAEATIAESFCNGMPVSFLDASKVIQYGDPETNVQIYNRALKSLDSAVTNTTASSARGDTVKWLSAIVRARVLLDLGDYAQAGTTVTAAGIPNNLKFMMFYSQNVPGPDNQIWDLNNNAGRLMVASNEGPLLLNPASANDPRVPVCIGGSAACKSLDPLQTRDQGFDNTFAGSFLVQGVWPNRDADVAIVMATEARLIEAEAALRSGDPTWLAKLNFLRANYATFKQPADPCPASGTNVPGCPQIAAGGNLLPPLADPGTQTAREDLLFRERAFWLWSTGRRLPDLRRLVRPVAEGGFGRPENSVFPNGDYFKGGIYGTDRFLLVPVAEQNNPQYKGCLDLNP